MTSICVWKMETGCQWLLHMSVGEHTQWTSHRWVTFFEQIQGNINGKSMLLKNYISASFEGESCWEIYCDKWLHNIPNLAFNVQNVLYLQTTFSAAAQLISWMLLHMNSKDQDWTINLPINGRLYSPSIHVLIHCQNFLTLKIVTVLSQYNTQIPLACRQTVYLRFIYPYFLRNESLFFLLC